VLWAQRPSSVLRWRSVKPGNPNMFTLIAMAGHGVPVQAGRQTIAPGCSPTTSRDMDGNVHVYFEAALSLCVARFLLGQVMGTARAQRQVRRDPRLLQADAADGADHPRGWQRGKMSISTGQIGDRCASARRRKCRWTARWRGPSSVDESMVTGEPCRWRSGRRWRVTAAR